MKRYLFGLLLCVSLLAFLAPAAHAQEQAIDITDQCSVTGGGVRKTTRLTDGDEVECLTISKPLKISCETGIGGIYLVFDQPCVFTVQDPESGKSVTRENLYLHEFVSTEELGAEPVTQVELRFPQGALLCEVRIYSPGTVPGSVQQWSSPLDAHADIVLFSTHGDDEQLYFAGLLPEYAGQRQLDVQVVYMTGHDNLVGSLRRHEMLNGLWAVGVRAYPVFGPFPDFKILDREQTYTEYENRGFSRADLLRFVVGNLRRFRPQVAIGHDLEGEYGHGMHMVYADLLTQALEISADPEVFPEQVAEYGTWDVPKAYLHLYPKNPITLDYDHPLSHFDGMTAFEATQKLGFPCHVSQQYDLYTHWLYGEETPITSPTEITQWSPCDFGLYRSTVGADVEKNDFMENLTSYAQQEAQAAALSEPQETTDPTDSGNAYTEGMELPRLKSLSPVQEILVYIGCPLLFVLVILVFRKLFY